MEGDRMAGYRMADYRIGGLQGFQAGMIGTLVFCLLAGMGRESIATTKPFLQTEPFTEPFSVGQANPPAANPLNQPPIFPLDPANPSAPSQPFPPGSPPTNPISKPTPANPTQVNPKQGQEQTKPPTQRKQPPAREFPPNPLEITAPDPLIPFDYKDRSLTNQERQEIMAAANRLMAVGATKLQQGDRIGAFEAWNRELRFRRLLGPLAAEVRALGRVGDIAWRENEQTQLRYITKRLDDILAKNQLAKNSTAKMEGESEAAQTITESDLKTRIRLLEELGLAYQLVRLPKTAAGIYEQVLANARKRNDSLELEATLITLGQLHLAWFDYASAAKTYQELLGRAQNRQDLFNQPIYLSQLAYIHEQAKQPKEAIPYQEQLVAFYEQINNPEPIPSLKIKIADNYRLIEQLDQAEINYQVAYKLSTPQKQFGNAGDALRKLGEMYRSKDRLDSALRMFYFLVLVEQQAYNAYGAMNAYDQMGQVHALRKEYPQAIAAFQKGLNIARRLKIRENYFNHQIQQAEKGTGE
jgi:tetratricopeptide (TPR) repeat protein